MAAIWGPGVRANHHPIQCEVHKAHQDKYVKPQELFKSPMESNIE